MAFGSPIPDPENEPSRAYVLVYMQERWTNLVVERLENNREWYIHRSRLSKQRLDDWGRTDENLEDFVHITFENGDATIEQNCLTAARLKHAFIAWHKEMNVCRVAQNT